MLTHPWINDRGMGAPRQQRSTHLAEVEGREADAEAAHPADGVNQRSGRQGLLPGRDERLVHHHQGLHDL